MEPNSNNYPGMTPNIQNTPTAPRMPSTPTAPNTPNMSSNNAPMNNMPVSPVNGTGHKKVGPIVAILVIVLVLIIVALYLFASRINQQTEITPNDTATDQGTSQNLSGATTPSVPAVTNTADDVQSLQNDLNQATIGVDGQNF